MSDRSIRAVVDSLDEARRVLHVQADTIRKQDNSIEVKDQALEKQGKTLTELRQVIRDQGAEIVDLRQSVVSERAVGEIKRHREQLDLVREQLIDEHAVQDFSKDMIDELNHARGRGKGGWHNDTCSDDRLIDLLLKKIRKGGDGVWVHIANYAMMLYHRGATPAHLVEKAAPKMTLP